MWKPKVPGTPSELTYCTSILEVADVIGTQQETISQNGRALTFGKVPFSEESLGKLLTQRLGDVGWYWTLTHAKGRNRVGCKLHWTHLHLKNNDITHW